MPSILNVIASAAIVDSTTVALLFSTGAGGRKVREWYRTLRIGAYALDVLSIIIAVSVAIKVTPVLWKQIVCVVAIQLLHDVSFGAFVKSDLSKGPLMQLFKRYATEMGGWILFADAIMLVCTLILAHCLSHADTDTSVLSGLIASYIGLLFVYSFNGA